MSEPGGATPVGSIVAFLRMDRGDWVRGKELTEEEAARLGRLSPTIRIDTNASSVIVQLGAVAGAERAVGQGATEAKAPVIGLLGALLALSPAAIPIGAVLTGGMAGALPVLAAVALGIKGITNEQKSGQLQTTIYARDFQTLHGFLTQIETTASAGILTGIDRGLRSAHPLFGLINSDIGVMSRQLGGIIAGGAPALARILIQLNPLFVTFGNLLDRGAAELQHWSKSSDGVTQFVAYAQSELPQVMQFLGNLVVLFIHLTSAAAPMGGVILGGLGVLVRVLDEIPINVLEILLPLLLGLYAGFKAYAGITVLVAAVNSALSSHAAQAALTAATVAAAEAEEANAALAAARLRLSLVEGINAGYASEAAAAVASAETQAAAANASAEAAQAQAVKLGAAARSSEASWAAVLGPIGAVAVGIGFLTLNLLNNQKGAQQAAAAMDSYSQSVQHSTDALDAQNIAQTNTNLSKSKALEQLSALHDMNYATSVSFSDLTKAVNGSDYEFNTVIGTLTKVIQTGRGLDPKAQANALIDTLTLYRRGLQGQIETQKELNAASEQTQNITDRQAASAARLYGLVGEKGVAAYLAAKDAADKNASKTREQTLAFQLENNAIGLVNQALQTMAGQDLNLAQAQTALDSAILSLVASLKQNGDTVADNTDKGVANQQAIEAAVQALQSRLQAEAQATGSTAKATAEYRKNAAALLEQIGRIDGTTSSVYKYAQQLLKLPPIVKTKIDLDADKAKRDLDATKSKASGVSGELGNLTKRGWTIHVIANVDQTLANIAKVMAALGKLISLQAATQTGGQLALKGYVPAYAEGGTIDGPGTAKSDSVLGLVVGSGRLVRLSRGEEVTPEPYASAFRPLLKAIGAGDLGSIAPRVLANAPAYPQHFTTGPRQVVQIGRIDKLVEQNYPMPERGSDAVRRAAIDAADALGAI